MTKPFRTPRLNLRAFVPDDAEAMHRIISGKDVLRYFPTDRVPSLDRVRAALDRWQQHWNSRGYGLWAVEIGDRGELIGRGGLQHIPDTGEVEIDFLLDRNHWGKGYATEVAAAGLRFGFCDLAMESIVGIVHPDNVASQRVLEKVGMGERRRAVYFELTCYRYQIQREAYLSRLQA